MNSGIGGARGTGSNGGNGGARDARGGAEICRILDFPNTMKRILAGLHGPGNGVDLDGEWTEADHLLKAVPDWAAEAGAAFRPSDGAFVVWLAPGEEKKPAFPSRLRIDASDTEAERGRPMFGNSGAAGATAEGATAEGAIAKGAMTRRSIVTWDTGKRAFTGSEIFTGSPILAGPPFCGAALIIYIRTLGTAENAAGETARHDMEQ